jgi:hypothetical protein
MDKINNYTKNITKQVNKLKAIRDGKEYETTTKFKFPNAEEVKEYLRKRIYSLKKTYTLPEPPESTSLKPPASLSSTQPASLSSTQPASLSSTQPAFTPPPFKGGKHNKSRKNRKRRTILKNKKTKRKTKRKNKNVFKRSKKKYKTIKKHKRTRKKKQYKH